MYEYIALCAQEFLENRYYSQRACVSDVPVGQAYCKYNDDQPAGIFQLWKYAQWQSDTGERYVYVLGSNGWEFQRYKGKYWWFAWVVYEKQIR